MKRRLEKLWSYLIGMRLAVWLDHHTDWCWANLCASIGLGYDLFSPREWWEDRSGIDCQTCEHSCWCGKFVRVGDEVVLGRTLPDEFFKTKDDPF